MAAVVSSAILFVLMGYSFKVLIVISVELERSRDNMSFQSVLPPFADSYPTLSFNVPSSEKPSWIFPSK